MSHSLVPKYLLDDINEFIHVNYHYSLPHSLIIAQAFCLRFKNYGNDFGVSEITDAIEYVKKSLPQNQPCLIIEGPEGLY